jgi:peptidoglycan/xylan/chitin deacetylase (PgdA/CDA1 family)
MQGIHSSKSDDMVTYSLLQKMLVPVLRDIRNMITMTRCTMYLLLFGALFSTLPFASQATSRTATPAVLLDNAVLLQYHHVADDTPAITSTRPEVFAEHMAYLAAHYTVLPVPTIIESLQHGKPLPDKTIGITFDDGYENIYRIAHPILRQYNFPYTVFINPPSIGKSRGQLTWQQIAQMQQEGVTFANHTLDHLHLLNRLENESPEQWLTRVIANIEEAETELNQRIGYSLRYLAYPFGEFNTAIQRAVTDAGYVGFAQFSGGIASFSDFSALPRYPAGGRYASLRTLKTKMASLAFPVLTNNITDPVVTDTMPSDMVLTVDNSDFYLSQVSCFYQGERLVLTRQDNQVSMPLPEVFPVGRSRINCTAPSKQHKGRFYWYSQPFFRANATGKYPD